MTSNNKECCDQKSDGQLIQRNDRSLPPAPRLDPWLVFIHEENGETQTFFSLSENRYYVKHIPDMHGKIILHCKFGWMVMRDQHSDDFFLFNPISMEKIQLPQWEEFKFQCCLLTSPPNDPSCSILFVDNLDNGIMGVKFCKPGDIKWSYQEFEDYFINDALCCKGKIYSIGNHNDAKVMSLLEVGDTISIKELEGQAQVLPEKILWTIRLRLRMVESCEDIYLVYFHYMGYELPEIHDIEICKMNLATMAWERVQNIGDQAFFFGCGTSTSCSAKEAKIKGNMIYFTQGQDTTLYAYDIEEREITIILACPNIESNWTQAVWISY